MSFRRFIVLVGLVNFYSEAFPKVFSLCFLNLRSVHTLAWTVVLSIFELDTFLNDFPNHLEQSTYRKLTCWFSQQSRYRKLKLRMETLETKQHQPINNVEFELYWASRFLFFLYYCYDHAILLISLVARKQNFLSILVLGVLYNLSPGQILNFCPEKMGWTGKCLRALTTEQISPGIMHF